MRKICCRNSLEICNEQNPRELGGNLASVQLHPANFNHIPYRFLASRQWVRAFQRKTRQVNSMFERFTEKARRVIFFARCEASQYGSPFIETEHLLLGLS